jgi:hypothetical protein
VHQQFSMYWRTKKTLTLKIIYCWNLNAQHYKVKPKSAWKVENFLIAIEILTIDYFKCQRFFGTPCILYSLFIPTLVSAQRSHCHSYYCIFSPLIHVTRPFTNTNYIREHELQGSELDNFYHQFNIATLTIRWDPHTGFNLSTIYRYRATRPRLG